MKINVPEKYADLYLKALGERKRMLEAKIEDFRREIVEIENHISALTSLPIFQDSASINIPKYESSGYRAEWAWTKKIAHYQGFKLKIFTSGEIVDFILTKEPELKKAKVRSSISAALSNKIKQGIYLKFIDPISGATYYGPPEWFAQEQEPHLNYLPEDLKERLLGK